MEQLSASMGAWCAQFSNLNNYPFSADVELEKNFVADIE
jgi:hypothetical protein